MTYNYYFDSDERDYSVKPPRMTAEEIDELNNNDENWFKYMMKKEPIVYGTENYTYTNQMMESEVIYDDDSMCDSEDDELDEN